jgi:hypothetical protein
MDTLYSMEKLTDDKIKGLRNEGQAQQAHQPRNNQGAGVGSIISRFFAWISNRGSDRRETGLVIR